MASERLESKFTIENSKSIGDREEGFVWMYQTEMKDRMKEEMERSRDNSLTVRPQWNIAILTHYALAHVFPLAASHQ
jgi:hypothetical protein